MPMDPVLGCGSFRLEKFPVAEDDLASSAAQAQWLAAGRIQFSGASDSICPGARPFFVWEAVNC